MRFDMGKSWEEALEGEFSKDYFRKLEAFVSAEYSKGTVYPTEERIFSAFRTVPPEKVKIVILGQDPYHEEGQANGNAFAVNKGVRKPASLRNIFKEIGNEYGKEPIDETLISWADQGVFLLNTVLTVRKGEAGSHSKKGWEIFTDRVIGEISDKREGVVFMLWGANAWKKEALIDGKKHLILKSAHPSPLSAYRGFFGNGHFKKANEYLKEKGIETVNWC